LNSPTAPRGGKMSTMEKVRRLHNATVAAVHKQIDEGLTEYALEAVEWLRSSASALEQRATKRMAAAAAGDRAGPSQGAALGESLALDESLSAMDREIERLNEVLAAAMATDAEAEEGLGPLPISSSSNGRQHSFGGGGPPPPSPESTRGGGGVVGGEVEADEGVPPVRPSSRPRMRSLSRNAGDFTLRHPMERAHIASVDQLGEMNPALMLCDTPRGSPMRAYSPPSDALHLGSTHLRAHKQVGFAAGPPRLVSDDSAQRIRELELQLFKSWDEIATLRKSSSSPPALRLPSPEPEPHFPPLPPQASSAGSSSSSPRASPSSVALHSPRSRRERGAAVADVLELGGGGGGAEAARPSMRVSRRGSTLGLEATKVKSAAQTASVDMGRRMSLSSILRDQGDANMSKIEGMVSLLTSISTARDAGTLVSIMLHGIVNLGAPDCSSCHFWVCALDKTFSASLSGEVSEREGLYSSFMRALYSDPDRVKVNVPAASFRVLSSPGVSRLLSAGGRTFSDDSSSSPRSSPASVVVSARTAGQQHPQPQQLLEDEEEDDDDGPQSALALAAFDAQRNLLGILEVRNSPMMTVMPRDFVSATPHTDT
jgi:hypothetical protein